MLSDKKISLYDQLPVLNFWYETQPNDKEKKTCQVSFSAEPPTVHKSKSKNKASKLNT
ncbi:hypothetical protein BY458DRAFT_497231 [Sporodiniella umbellata]|nr:hypothetical protein BY458DRAFT_497231 [Sporodiniella umbellata]